MVRAGTGVYGDALKAIGAHDVQIIIRGLNLERYPSRAELTVPPHQRVLKDLLSRVNDRARAYGQWTLIIADEIDGAAEHQPHFRLYQRDGSDGTGCDRLPEIVDTIHFAPSRASRLLQAADLVAHLYRRLASGQGSGPRARQTSERPARPRPGGSACPLGFRGRGGRLRRAWEPRLSRRPGWAGTAEVTLSGENFVPDLME
ncbi:DUF3800 domain-containing protein [Streptomyces broussonetiae]|uniref:DUF3800 domain-containing protein n=2 Tax=Streptomyces broussonetiae TaxID=2686304 RepID=A0A6I6N1I9_9ACTN|nr:DUF3800 domain-containing protein [Streptomyces broussonetiae]